MPQISIAFAPKEYARVKTTGHVGIIKKAILGVASPPRYCLLLVDPSNGMQTEPFFDEVELEATAPGILPDFPDPYTTTASNPGDGAQVSAR